MRKLELGDSECRKEGILFCHKIDPFRTEGDRNAQSNLDKNDRKGDDRSRNQLTCQDGSEWQKLVSAYALQGTWIEGMCLCCVRSSNS